jgi:hypothetical protein
MAFLSTISPDAGSKLVVAIAVGALTTAGVGAGTATLLTGSPDPFTWFQAYRHSSECRQAGAVQDPSCSAAAAQAIFERNLAAGIEQKAKDLSARVKNRPASVLVATPRPTARPPDPLPTRVQPIVDDSGGHDD